MSSKTLKRRYAEEREGPDRAPAVARRGRAGWPGTDSAPESGLNDRRRRRGRTASRNWSVRAGREAAYPLEDSPSGKPSRLSTRGGANRQKPSHPQRSAKVNEIGRQRVVGRAR